MRSVAASLFVSALALGPLLDLAVGPALAHGQVATATPPPAPAPAAAAAGAPGDVLPPSQATPTADARSTRIGLELAAGLQAGRIICESEGDFCNDFTEAGGLNLNASYFFSPTFGIAVDLWVMAHTEDDFTFAHYVNTIGLRWRPVPILTLAAGIGAAHATLEYDGAFQASVTSDDAFAIMAAAALDLVRARRWALSLEARFGNGFYGDEDDNGEADVIGRNVGVGVGVAFFGF